MVLWPSNWSEWLWSSSIATQPMPTQGLLNIFPWARGLRLNLSACISLYPANIHTHVHIYTCACTHTPCAYNSATLILALEPWAQLFRISASLQLCTCYYLLFVLLRRTRSTSGLFLGWFTIRLWGRKEATTKNKIKKEKKMSRQPAAHTSVRDPHLLQTPGQFSLYTSVTKAPGAT